MRPKVSSDRKILLIKSFQKLLYSKCLLLALTKIMKQ